MGKIICQRCKADCCGDDTVMQLDFDERLFMEETGNSLVELFRNDSGSTRAYKIRINRGIIDPVILKPDEGIYRLPEPCKNLIERDGWKPCREHDNPRIPEVCKLFRPGGPTCRQIRQKRRMVQH